ncbi:hypothetical protein GJ496_003270 [Pomphorhynchus laevis]|nr:hypothetical protein GJ496_003270 [Pomphorhynchus laevis]
MDKHKGIIEMEKIWSNLIGILLIVGVSILGLVFTGVAVSVAVGLVISGTTTTSAPQSQQHKHNHSPQLHYTTAESQLMTVTTATLPMMTATTFTTITTTREPTTTITTRAQITTTTTSEQATTVITSEQATTTTTVEATTETSTPASTMTTTNSSTPTTTSNLSTSTTTSNSSTSTTTSNSSTPPTTTTNSSTPTTTTNSSTPTMTTTTQEITTTKTVEPTTITTTPAQATMTTTSVQPTTTTTTVQPTTTTTTVQPTTTTTTVQPTTTTTTVQPTATTITTTTTVQPTATTITTTTLTTTTTTIAPPSGFIVDFHTNNDTFSVVIYYDKETDCSLVDCESYLDRLKGIEFKSDILKYTVSLPIDIAMNLLLTHNQYMKRIGRLLKRRKRTVKKHSTQVEARTRSHVLFTNPTILMTLEIEATCTVNCIIANFDEAEKSLQRALCGILAETSEDLPENLKPRCTINEQISADFNVQFDQIPGESATTSSETVELKDWSAFVTAKNKCETVNKKILTTITFEQPNAAEMTKLCDKLNIPALNEVAPYYINITEFDQGLKEFKAVIYYKYYDTTGKVNCMTRKCETYFEKLKDQVMTTKDGKQLFYTIKIPMD